MSSSWGVESLALFVNLLRNAFEKSLRSFMADCNQIIRNCPFTPLLRTSLQRKSVDLALHDRTNQEWTSGKRLETKCLKILSRPIG
mmetsp:Transcript_9814/g.19321  ORF Transcript_9814/g.19321 Transcript_9814/m.19321 type:complete len:86 (+) Transcript_9814:4306-4563(+)